MNVKALGVVALHALFAVTLACGDDEGDGTGGSRDAGSDGSSGDDGGAGDSGGDVNDGGTAACDPLTGSGCPGPNQTCIVEFGPSQSTEVSCREAISRVGFEAVCDLATQNCEAGLTCISFEGTPGPACYRVCTEGGTACEGLSGASDSYFCESFGDFGFCAGLEGCDPLDADSCPATQNCSFAPNETFACGPAGTADAGMSCASSPCQKGLLCVDFGGGPECTEPCPVNSSGSCSNAGVCVGFTGSPVSFCRPSCTTPTDETACGPTENCTIGSEGLACLPAGTVQIGDACQFSNDCVRGGVCVNDACRQACDAMFPARTHR
ncbi:MAG: hypothetical protein HC923_13580 [Myxococcales bacterium]|nr:hypothetical protein [Myxococcales bacterium]